MGKEELVKKQKENKKKLRQGMRGAGDEFYADSLRIQQAALDGSIRATLVGNGRIWIENYRSISEYCDRRILLLGKKESICIEGERLVIDYYTCDDMLIRGRIDKILLEALSHGRNH